MRGVAAGANPVVDHFPRSGGAGLRNDVDGEVVFVEWRTDARAEVHDEIRGLDAEPALQERDGRAGDIRRGAGPTGMGQTDGTPPPIGNENGGAISHVDAESKAALRGDQSIDPGMRSGGGGHGHTGAVDLLGSGELPGREAAGAEILVVGGSQTLQCVFAVGRHVDARDARNERGADARYAGERLELTRCRGHSQRFLTLCLDDDGVGVGLAFFSLGGLRGSVSFFFGIAPLRTPGLGFGAELS